ncbi:hypothetical protein FHR34_007241 [Kitasatospora kifunensis]|uniref:Uncharacterized protein n=1 Tax=Kitasatospora kifunensis TaxID=58351 RepID=A0A7W7RA16_KITKI|nr:hypothetical protein [Kitasatospora kifunensis]
MPRSRVTRSTRLWFTALPAACTSAVIRGLP